MFQTYSWRNEVDICSYLCISYQYEATRHQVKEGICQSCSKVQNSRKRSFKQINNKMLETNKKTEKAVFRGFSYRINRQIPPSTKNINGINIFCPRGELSPPLIVHSKLLDKSIKRSSLPKIFNKNCFRNYKKKVPSSAIQTYKYATPFTTFALYDISRKHPAGDTFKLCDCCGETRTNFKAELI